MDSITVDNQIILFEAILKFFPQSENKDLVIPLIFQWFNERSTQFVPAPELREICTTLFEFNKSNQNKTSVPFQFNYT